LNKIIPALEARQKELNEATVEESAEPVRYNVEKVKDLQKSLADVNEKQNREVQALDRVRDHLHDLVEPEEYKPKVKEEDRDLVIKKPDVSAF
jgi:REP element-mobilizing transposase RayT